MFESSASFSAHQARPCLDRASRRTVGRHQYRVASLSGLLAENIGLPDDHCRTIARAAALHDVGKIFIPGEILEKPGGLDAAEMAFMQQHSQLGHAYLLRFSHIPVARYAATIALQHHEHWDGSGYPHGLFGEQISIGARIVTICDVYDALREDRFYRPGLSHDVAAEVIRHGDEKTPKGTFDPAVSEAFLRCEKQIAALFDKHRPAHKAN